MQGVSRLFVQNFLSHSTEKFRWGALRCIGKLRVSKNFMHQRGGGYHVSPSKTFVTQYRKISLGNSSVFQKISFIAKFYAQEGDITKLRWKIFVSVPIKFVGEYFCVSKEFWYRKFSSKGGGSFTVLSKIFYLTGPKKLCQGTTVFQKF